MPVAKQVSRSVAVPVGDRSGLCSPRETELLAERAAAHVHVDQQRAQVLCGEADGQVSGDKVLPSSGTALVMRKQAFSLRVFRVMMVRNSRMFSATCLWLLRMPSIGVASSRLRNHEARCADCPPCRKPAGAASCVHHRPCECCGRGSR